VKIKIDFNEYTLNYYYNIGLNFSESEINAVKNQLHEVNKASGCNFSYGIFDSTKDFKKITENFLICVIEKDNNPVGFFYNFILNEPKVVHLGLVLISKNFGDNLLYIPYMIASRIIHDHIGDFYITNISGVPKIIGTVIEIYDEVWPAPKSNLMRPPPEYKTIANSIYSKYVKEYFPMPESISFDEKKFILSCNAKEMGFENDFRKLPRHSTLDVNLFCMFWLNYEKNEDIIQVGKYTKETVEKNHSLIYKFYNPLL